MFTYQTNTHFSQAVECSREEFWKSIEDSSNRWRIDSRRDILKVVGHHDEQGLKRWLKNTDYQKFLAKKRGMKQEKARQAFFDKSDEERLLAFAQELKDNLTAFIFACREFDAKETKKGDKSFRHRKLEDCHLNGLVMLDIDHVEKPLEIFEKLKANEELMKRTALVHITSSEKGVRIVFIADAEVGNLADNQIVFAQQLGYKADESCIDATRNSFCPKKEDILYINEELLFDYYDEEFDKRYTPQYRDKKTKGSLTPNNQSPNSLTPNPSPNGEGSGQTSGSGNRETTNLSTPLSIRRGDGGEADGADGAGCLWRGFSIQRIIDARYPKLPCAADSNRHNESLKLATDLLLMLDGDKQRVLQIVEQQPWVQEIIAERNENVAQTVQSAAQRMTEREGKNYALTPSKVMQEAILHATGKTFKEIVTQSENPQGNEVTTPLPTGEGQGGGSLADDEMSKRLWLWGARISDMMADYPILKDVCKGLKPNQYPAALFVAGGLMMTLMTRCSYRFYHRPEELRRLNNSTLIIGDPASGKSFATRLFKLLAAPIVAADEVGKEAVNAYREQMKTKGANKEKPKKPKVVIRVHPARTSNAQFIQDIVNAIEDVDGQKVQLHMLTFDTELDNSLTVQKGGSWIDKQSLQLKAFHNEQDGQAYSNIDSILQDFIVVWNFIYTGTPIAMKKMVNEQNFGTGLATRLSAIPLPSTNFEMMTREPTIDLDSDARLSEWAVKLDRTKGELPFSKLVDELYDWTARRMADAAENESKADEMLLKRCAYHGLNFAAPFIMIRHWSELKKDGEFWCGEFETDETDWKLVELIVNIQFACQRYFFGAMAEAYFDNQQKSAATNVQHHQKTHDAFARLPEEFTIEDVVRCFNVNNEAAARKRVTRLMKDGLVVKEGEQKAKGTHIGLYKKTSNMII